MEEIIGKPIDPSASGGAIPDSPPKRTISLIRERMRGPFSRYPAVNRPISATKPTVLTIRQKIVSPVSRHPAVDERISKPPLKPISSLEAELPSRPGRDRDTARPTLGEGLAVSAFPRSVPV
jgi:hypothetical protein